MEGSVLAVAAAEPAGASRDSFAGKQGLALPGETHHHAARVSPRAEPAPTATVSEAGRLRVLLADDHPLVREGLAGLLRLEPDIDLVGEALDGEMALQMVRQLQPDVVVLDVSMPQINGIAATHHIASEMPQVRIIVLSCYTEEEMAMTLREAGAAAYLTKDAPVDELLAAIRGGEPPARPQTPK